MRRLLQMPHGRCRDGERDEQRRENAQEFRHDSSQGGGDDAKSTLDLRRPADHLALVAEAQPRLIVELLRHGLSIAPRARRSTHAVEADTSAEGPGLTAHCRKGVRITNVHSPAPKRRGRGCVSAAGSCRCEVRRRLVRQPRAQPAMSPRRSLSLVDQRLRRGRPHSGPLGLDRSPWSRLRGGHDGLLRS